MKTKMAALESTSYMIQKCHVMNIDHDEME